MNKILNLSYGVCWILAICTALIIYPLVQVLGGTTGDAMMVHCGTYGLGLLFLGAVGDGKP